MRVHFFSRIDLHSRTEFREYYLSQNLTTTQKVSVVCFLLSLSIRLIVEVFKLPIQKINHLDEYDLSNWVSLVLSPLFYLGALQLSKLFEIDKKYANAAQVFVFVFTLFIIINTMRASFYSMHNPRNTLVMYMLGLIIVGVFFTFEYYETLILTLFTGVIFSITLSFYQHEFAEVFMNNMASFVLLTVFFSMARIMYSYRADNFLKLRAIEEKNVEIENASQVKNEILGVVAHDLRNPLAAIKSIAMMMEDDTSLDEDNQDNLRFIKMSCDKATSIINDLLETANNEMGHEFELVQVEMNKFLLLIVDEWLKNKQGKVNILFYGTKNPVYTLLNKEKMQRAMDNLISNAFKFSGTSDYIDIILSDSDGEVLINIKDVGVGIPEDMIPYIFDRFSKASRKGIRGEDSIGLGLSIVRQIVEKHSGVIEVNSKVGEGTIFTIRLKSVA